MTDSMMVSLDALLARLRNSLAYQRREGRAAIELAIDLAKELAVPAPHQGTPGNPISRIEAIRVVLSATDTEGWEWLVQDHYDEDADWLPSIYHIVDALGVTESEYREASGVDPSTDLDWGNFQPPEQEVLS